MRPEQAGVPRTLPLLPIFFLELSAGNLVNVRCFPDPLVLLRPCLDVDGLKCQSNYIKAKPRCDETG